MRTPGKTTVPTTSNRQQRVLRQTPYRLALQKPSAKLPTKNSIDLNHVPIDQLNPTLLVPSTRGNYYNEISPPNTARWVQQLSDISIAEATSVSFKMPEKPLISDDTIGIDNLTGRDFTAGMKVKPMLLLILSAVLAALFVTVISRNYTDDRTESEILDRYNKFSHEMFRLQTQYTHQSVWFWHNVRVTGWRALTEPLYSMPMALLIVIPYRQEQIGYCLATSVVNAFNKIHNQKQQSNIPLFYRQTETTPTIKELSLAIQTARDAHMSAVLVDHLEKLPRATVPTLDNFIHPYGYNAENRLLVFTLYAPSVHCNSEFVWDHLSNVWQIKVINWPSLVRDLKYNTVFVNSDDEHVNCI